MDKTERLVRQQEHGLPALLIVEDSDEDYELACWALRRAGFDRPIQRSKSVDEALRVLCPSVHTRSPCAMLLDVNLPDGTGRDVLECVHADDALPPFPIVMITTSSNPRDVELYYRLGAAGYLVKPLDRDLFAQQIGAFVNYWFMAAVLPESVFLSNMSHEVHTPTAARNTEATLRARCAGRQVLLVEDSIVNRKIAVELLRRVGLRVDTAADGIEAVERARDGNHDLILMDVQMPRLDGLEATRQIRTLESWRSRPILALTANAFAEDRCDCEAAGMSDFISKPFDTEQLYASLLKWLPKDEPASVAQAPDDAGGWRERLAQIAGLDLPAALVMLDGKDALLARFLWMLANNHEADVTRIREFMAVGDPAAAARVVHGLKGVAGSLGARGVFAASQAVETLLREGAQGSRIEAGITGLDRELSALVKDIRQQLPQAGDDAPSNRHPHGPPGRANG